MEISAFSLKSRAHASEARKRPSLSSRRFDCLHRVGTMLNNVDGTRLYRSLASGIVRVHGGELTLVESRGRWMSPGIYL